MATKWVDLHSLKTFPHLKLDGWRAKTLLVFEGVNDKHQWQKCRKTLWQSCRCTKKRMVPFVNPWHIESTIFQHVKQHHVLILLKFRDHRKVSHQKMSSRISAVVSYTSSMHVNISVLLRWKKHRWNWVDLEIEVPQKIERQGAGAENNIICTCIHQHHIVLSIMVFKNQTWLSHKCFIATCGPENQLISRKNFLEVNPLFFKSHSFPVMIRSYKHMSDFNQKENHKDSQRCRVAVGL